MDIGYGPECSPGGHKYALILVDQCTTYTWVYGMSGTFGADIQEALRKFFIDGGGFPAIIHCDFDTRSLGGKAKALKLLMEPNLPIEYCSLLAVLVVSDEYEMEKQTAQHSTPRVLWALH